MTHDHHHDHDHDHHGHHHHAPANFDRAFAIGVALNLGFVAIELAYGLGAHSLALVADAGHNFSDVFSLVLAWGAAFLARRSPSARRTYGYGRGTILASLTNAVILFAVVIAIAWGAVGRFLHPAPVETGVVIWVALAGIFVNGITAVLFLRGRKEDINIQGAFLHMAGDALISLGVVVTGIVIGLTDWLWLDPAASIAISIIIAMGTFGLLRDSFDLALDAVPPQLDRGAVEGFLASLPGVQAVHDLHIWPLSTTSIALTAHIVRPGGADDTWLHATSAALNAQFKINHTTLQIETGMDDCECKLAPNEVI